jgi:hypothetical protein
MLEIASGLVQVEHHHERDLTHRSAASMARRAIAWPRAEFDLEETRGRPPAARPVASVIVRLMDAMRVIPGYTRGMKTAISIPDETFGQAERRAAALGMSRSEFFTRAAQHYLQELDAQSLTARIDAALTLVGVDESTTAAVTAAHRLLAADEDAW